MAKLFIHITSGPELPNKVSLGLLVAAASDKK
ncbi:MAG: multidrug transporter, partial [SAR202 cluster bacterium]|nr:multidrug transporter [SAR202 cluster bacterium]